MTKQQINSGLPSYAEGGFGYVHGTVMFHGTEYSMPVAMVRDLFHAAVQAAIDAAQDKSGPWPATEEDFPDVE